MGCVVSSESDRGYETVIVFNCMKVFPDFQQSLPSVNIVLRLCIRT